MLIAYMLLLAHDAKSFALKSRATFKFMPTEFSIKSMSFAIVTYAIAGISH